MMQYLSSLNVVERRTYGGNTRNSLMTLLSPKAAFEFSVQSPPFVLANIGHGWGSFKRSYWPRLDPELDILKILNPKLNPKLYR
jgi:hypothetical protein